MNQRIKATEEQKKKMLDLASNGLSVRQIARTINLGKSQVHSYLSKNRGSGSIPAPATSNQITNRRIITLSPAPAPKPAPVSPKPEKVTVLTTTGIVTSKDKEYKVEESKTVFSPLVTQYIPTCEERPYISRIMSDDRTDIEVLDKAKEILKEHILIVGDTGTGKTHAVQHYALIKKLPYFRISLDGTMTPSELFGQFVPKKEGDGWDWVDGLLTKAVRYGGVVVFDEINMCPAEITSSLHSLLDGSKSMTLFRKDGEVIQAHPELFITATMNPDYEGTKPLNEAFRDRFTLKLIFDYDTKVEGKLIENKVILELARKLRVMRQKGEVSTPISPRMLLAYQKHVKVFSEKLAMEFFLNNFQPHERQPIKDIYELLHINKAIKGEDKK